jgi:hypothetical protein
MLNCCTSSSDISGCHADFHEGHGTVGAGQGNDTGTAWARHAICESVLSGESNQLNKYAGLIQICSKMYTYNVRKNVNDGRITRPVGPWIGHPSV